MRAGDHHHSSTGQDEKQSLLDNINQIKIHGSYPDTLGRDAVHNAITGMQGAFLGAKASAQDTLGKCKPPSTASVARFGPGELSL